MDTHHTPRWIDPDEQVDNLKATIAFLREFPPHESQRQALRAAVAHLAELVAKRGRGKLEPVWYDPFHFPWVSVVVRAPKTSC